MPSRSVICIAGVKRVIALVEELAPGETPHKKKRIVSQILSLLDGQDRDVRMTPGLLSELIAVHSSCVHDQEGRCPLLVSIASLCWEINQATAPNHQRDPPSHEAPLDHSARFSPCIDFICVTHDRANFGTVTTSKRPR